MNDDDLEIPRAEMEAGWERVLAKIERREELEGYRGWFGESWGAPINRVQQHLPTPENEDCAFCGEPIRPNDQGYIMPFEDVDGLKRLAAHRRCHHIALGLKV